MENNKISIKKFVESAVSILQGMLTKAADNIIAFLNSVEALEDNENIKAIGKVMEATGEIVEALKIIKQIYSFPTILFMHKLEKFCRGLSEIPLEKRESYLKKTKKISRQKESLVILNIINRIEEMEKIDIIVRLLKAKMYDEIDDTEFRRLVIMTGDTLYGDLRYMGVNIVSDNFPIKDDAQEGLLGNGWIRPVGLGLGTFGDNTDSDYLFAYNKFAKLFCRIVFDKSIDIQPPSKKGIIGILDNEKIDEYI